MDLEILTCRSCNCIALDDLGACTPFRDAPNIDPGRLLRCRQCSLGQRHPVPDQATLIAMYRDTAAEQMLYRYEDNAGWSMARGRMLARYGETQSIAVLDVGCHTGAFLAGLPETWSRYGIESASSPIEVARTYGVKVIAERLESVPAEWKARFDVVTMFDVVEHLTNPDAGIAAAAQLLKPGGALMLSSGDLDAWTWSWLGSGHWYLQTPQHLSVISLEFIKKLTLRHDLKLVETQKIPHRYAPRAQRLRQAIDTLYWGLRQRGRLYRVPQRILQSLPGLKKLRHMQGVPWTMSLGDHVFVSLQVSGTSEQF